MTADGPGCHTILAKHYQLNSVILCTIAAWGKCVVRINNPVLQINLTCKLGTTDIKVRG